MQQVNLGMIGGGTVGSGVFHALQQNGELLSSRIGVRVALRKIAVKAFDEPRPYPIPESLMTLNWETVVNDPEVHAVIELVGGTLVLLGLGTRAASFIASGAMAYAYFDVHQPNALMPIQNQGELAAAFCWAFFLLVFTGSGAFGVDRFLAKRSSGATKASREKADKAPVAA